MVDLAALRSAQPGLLDRAADDWQMLSTRLGGQETALRSGVMQPLFGTGDWTGTAADAASASLGSLSRQLSVTQDYAATMTSLLRDAAGGVRDAQSLLRAAENLAAQNRLTIGADGSVSAEPAPPLLGGPGSASLLAQPPPAAGEVADLAARALSVADAVDGQITARFLDLQKFAGATSVAASELRGADRLAGSFDHAMLPPQGTSPAEVNQWWQALGSGQQQRLIREFPSQLGWMNGLPAQARSQANRIVMTDEKQQLQDHLASLQAHQPPQYSGAGRFGPETNPAWAQWQSSVSGIESKLAGIAAVERGLDLGGKNGYPPAYLLGFDTNGNGHAIVSFGNPDSADNTVTYVPGLGSKLTGAFNDSVRAQRLWGEAHTFDPGKQTASIYWLGYNAPQLGLSQGIHNLDVTSTADAVAGGQSLTQFQAGLQAAHQSGIPAHSVVLGHSYGSLVVGEAAARDSMHPSDVIFVGSPGVGVNHAGQLGMSSTHVWAGANSHDPVPQLPPSNPVTALSDPYAAHFGNNPATSAFGGQVIAADNDPSQSFSGLNLAAHSSYWDPNSDSLRNLGRIVDGQYGDVTVMHMPPPTAVPDPGPILGPGVL